MTEIEFIPLPMPKIEMVPIETPALNFIPTNGYGPFEPRITVVQSGEEIPAVLVESEFYIKLNP
jgi:hypothetical protein